MKGASKCAQRLKEVFGQLRRKLGKIAPPPGSDPITQLILGIFTRDVAEAKAREALDRLKENVVDYNELRVIPPLELVAMVEDLPGARLKCDDLSRALNRIFAQEHAVCLDRLSEMSKKDVQTYLDRIDGLEAYTRARIKLFALNIHAVPLDAAMWHLARKAEIVDAKSTLDEAQAFLERSIAPAEAAEFFALFRKHAWSEVGTQVKKGAVESVASVPPDRTTRNMLRQVASGDLVTIPQAEREADEDFEPPLDEFEPGLALDGEAPAGKRGKKAKRKSEAKPARSESKKAGKKPGKRAAADA